MFGSELFVTYEGTVMTWFARGIAGGMSGSDPVGNLSDAEALAWALKKREDIGADALRFCIEEPVLSSLNTAFDNEPNEALFKSCYICGVETRYKSRYNDNPCCGNCQR